LIDDIDNNDELAVILAVVDKSHSPNLDVPLERLHMKKKKKTQNRGSVRKTNQVIEQRIFSEAKQRRWKKPLTIFGRSAKTRRREATAEGEERAVSTEVMKY
jgi:hypothetical protein